MDLELTGTELITIKQHVLSAPDRGGAAPTLPEHEGQLSWLGSTSREDCISGDDAHKMYTVLLVGGVRC